MDLIAIGNILGNRDETIGLRLLDISNNQVKDVPIKSVVNVISSGQLTIRNVGVNGNEIKGICGSIDSLPKIKCNRLIGKSPMIILSRIGDIGFRISNWKGEVLAVKSQDLIKYGNINGLANGKIVNNSYISAKAGQFPVEKIQVSGSSVKRKDEKYLGKYLVDIKPLLPFRRIKDIYTSSIPYKDIYIEYDKRDEKLERRNIAWFSLQVEIDDINTDGICSDGKYTIAGKVYNTLYSHVNKDRKKLAEAIRVKEFRDKIDREILDMFKKRASSCRRDKKTNIPLPTLAEKYGTIMLNTKQLANAEDIDNETIEKYLSYLDVMEPSIFLEYDSDTKNIALARVVTSKGIDYSVIDGRDDSNVRKETIERIYDNHNDYSNVTIDEDIMTIVGLDGAYEYDMQKIYADYNRKILKSTKSAKSALLGIKHIEEIENNGLLRKLDTDTKEIVIPDNVTELGRESLYINETTERVIFNDNIKASSSRAIKVVNPGVVTVEFNCNEKAGLAITKSLLTAFTFENKLRRVVYKYNRDISPEEYLEIMLKKYTVRAEANNLRNNEFISDKLPKDIIGVALKQNKKIIEEILEVKELDSDSDYIVFRKKMEKLRNTYSHLYDRLKKSNLSTGILDDLIKLIRLMDNRLDKAHRSITRRRL